MIGCLRFVVILGLAGAAACAGGSRTVAVPGAGTTVMSRGAVHALEARWQDVTLGQPSGAGCPAATEAAPGLVTGDFNGDGAEDLALWVTTGDTPRLVVLLARLGDEYTVNEVSAGASIPSGGLEVGPRGGRYRLTTLILDTFYGVDTLLVRGCDGTRTAWFWTGATFDAQTVANTQVTAN